MTAKPNAKERLAAYMRRHPDASKTHSLTDLGRVVGVSRQRIRQLLPDYPAAGWRSRSRAALIARLQRYAEAHPERLRRPARGGMTFGQLAIELDTSPGCLRVAWRELGLPDRAKDKLTPQEQRRRNYESRRERHMAYARRWEQEHPERAREIRHAGQRRYRSKVLGVKECVVCGGEFPWTQGKENRLRRGAHIACSRRCARVASLLARDKGSKSGAEPHRTRTP